MSVWRDGFIPHPRLVALELSCDMVDISKPGDEYRSIEPGDKHAWLVVSVPIPTWIASAYLAVRYRWFR